MTTADPTTSLRAAGEPARTPMLRPRALATQLFADALHGDPEALERLRWLAVADDPDAIVAFTAIAVSELDRHEPPPLPPHRLDQLLAAVHEAAAADGRSPRA